MVRNLMEGLGFIMCMDMEYKSLKWEVNNRVAKITMNVPEKMNALCSAIQGTNGHHGHNQT